MNNDTGLMLDRLAQFVQLREQGYGVEAAGAVLGVSKRTAWTYAKAAKAEDVQRKLRDSLPPPLPPVPEGFEVDSLSTAVGPGGQTTSQHIRSSPEPQLTDNIPDGHVVKGLSTLVGPDGRTHAQWIKTKIDETKLAQLGEAVLAALNARIEPLPPVTAGVIGYSDYLESLATLYTMTDCHVGMLAWPKETQDAPWDTAIAERVLGDTFCRMIDQARPTGTAIINQLGDWLHFDSLLAVTPTSGNVLDSDSRYQLVVSAAVRILKRIVLHALQKHNYVHVYMNEGNHDMAGSVWLRVMFAELFRDNPRVDVHTNPNPYQALQFGKTMLGFYHGHLAKKPSLPLIYAAQYSEMWGATKHRYVHCGHLHSIHEQEHPGIVVIQHPTIASPDAYAARLGFLSKRQATAITYHQELGEIARATFLPVE